MGIDTLCDDNSRYKPEKFRHMHQNTHFDL